jgi:hypothetical protein
VATGEIEGTVYAERVDQSRRGVGGLNVHVVNREGERAASVRTFSDGLVYAIGVRPGHYELVVDPEQLERLDLTVRPKRLPFVVVSSEEGTAISGLDVLIGTKEELSLARMAREIARSVPHDQERAEALTRALIFDHREEVSVRIGEMCSTETATPSADVAALFPTTTGTVTEDEVRSSIVMLAPGADAGCRALYRGLYPSEEAVPIDDIRGHHPGAVVEPLAKAADRLTPVSR